MAFKYILVTHDKVIKNWLFSPKKGGKKKRKDESSINSITAVQKFQVPTSQFKHILWWQNQDQQLIIQVPLSDFKTPQPNSKLSIETQHQIFYYYISQWQQPRIERRLHTKKEKKVLNGIDKFNKCSSSGMLGRMTDNIGKGRVINKLICDMQMSGT